MGLPRKEIIALVADDNEQIRELICYELEKRGFTTRTARDGIETLGKIAEDKPNIIILDIAMPFLNGEEVCERLKEEPGTQNIPIILLSAQKPSEWIVQNKTGAPIKYIEKPCTFKCLLAQINALL